MTGPATRPIPIPRAASTAIPESWAPSVRTLHWWDEPDAQLVLAVVGAGLIGACLALLGVLVVVIADG